MRDALVTHGVNVRPQKVRHSSRPPRGIAVSAHYGHWLPPIVEARGKARERLSRELQDRAYRRRLDSVRAEMYAAQDHVKLLKAQGKSYKAAAAESRKARAAWLELTGGVNGHAVEVSQGADSNRIKSDNC